MGKGVEVEGERVKLVQPFPGVSHRSPVPSPLHKVEMKRTKDPGTIPLKQRNTRIPYGQISQGKKLGEGNFGVVRRGFSFLLLYV